MNEEEQQELLAELFDLVSKTENPDLLKPLENKLNQIKQQYGAQELQSLLNTKRIVEHEFSLLDFAEELSEATKLLLINGARPFKKANLSSITGKIILDIMQQNKGDTFSPTFVEYNDPDQLNAITNYLQYMHALVNKSDITFIPYNKTFILSKIYHWSCCQLQFSKSINGDPQIQMFFLDASGLKYWDKELLSLCSIAQEIFRDKNILIYRSNLMMQKDSGCKIFALLFARMMHSFTFGKFKRANPDYDLFKELAQISTTKTRIIGAFLEDIFVIDLPKLPAKFLQLTQRYYYHKITDGISIDDSSITDSRGNKLGDVIRKSNQEFIVTNERGETSHELRNMKIATKYASMQEMLQSYFSYFASDEEKISYLNLIERQFSVDALPKIIQRPSPR